MFEKVIEDLLEVKDDMERAIYNLKSPEDKKSMKSMTRRNRMFRDVKELKDSKSEYEDVDHIIQRLGEILGN